MSYISIQRYTALCRRETSLITIICSCMSALTPGFDHRISSYMCIINSDEQNPDRAPLKEVLGGQYNYREGGRQVLRQGAKGRRRNRK